MADSNEINDKPDGNDDQLFAYIANKGFTAGLIKIVEITDCQLYPTDVDKYDGGIPSISLSYEERSLPAVLWIFDRMAKHNLKPMVIYNYSGTRNEPINVSVTFMSASRGVQEAIAEFPHLIPDEALAADPAEPTIILAGGSFWLEEEEVKAFLQLSLEVGSYLIRIMREEKILREIEVPSEDS